MFDCGECCSVELGAEECIDVAHDLFFLCCID